jgi:thiol-disulfide isomerase/thioredoxin
MNRILASADINGKRILFRPFVALLCLAGFPCAVAALEAGARVPELVAAPLGGTGGDIRLDSLKGRVVYVDFWASWCVPCRQSMPLLDEMFRRFEPRGLTVLGVNKDVSVADAQRFLRRVPVSFPLAEDREDRLARAFAVKAMPSGYLIDRKGVVRHVHRGFTAESGTLLAVEIESLLREPS